MAQGLQVQRNWSNTMIYIQHNVIMDFGFEITYRNLFVIFEHIFISNVTHHANSKSNADPIYNNTNYGSKLN